MLPALLWAILILVLSGIPGNYFPRVVDFWGWLGPDKVVHLILFGTFALLLMRGFYLQYSFPLLRSYHVGISLAVGMVFGVLTEVLQKYVFIGRSGNIYDFGADVIGCLIGWLLFNLIKRKGALFLKKY
jgi:VanZ family protein